jgi:hypothetical protein
LREAPVAKHLLDDASNSLTDVRPNPAESERAAHLRNKIIPGYTEGDLNDVLGRSSDFLRGDPLNVIRGPIHIATVPHRHGMLARLEKHLAVDFDPSFTLGAPYAGSNGLTDAFAKTPHAGGFDDPPGHDVLMDRAFDSYDLFDPPPNALVYWCLG